MSPRRHHRAAADVAPLDEDRARRGVEHVQATHDGDWFVRSIPGDASEKTYRCPGCDQEIPPGVAHVVVWPADGRGDLTDRRHWHTSCWQSRDRRAPRLIRRR
ncbi:MAG TPA: hypothetical protein VFR11_05615 [Micromonosporaceae bacterium]|nr:hypothetical protein [Micromonosporaceae bacterium]